MIVDDEMDNLQILSRLLADCGYQVRSARDGATALMIAGADPPDLIVLDIKMPGMSGIDVCRQLKSREATCDIPVIFVSGLDDVADQVRGFEAGAIDYITKPFQLQDVETRVRTHLQLRLLQIENARLAEQARAAAVDAERQRLARELHDSVTQSLYSVILLSSGWQNMAKQGVLEDPASAFAQIGEVALDAIREMRLLIHQLRPPILDEIGLVRALQQRLDFVELRTDIEPQLETSGDVDKLPSELEEQLFLIAQEALNNTLRHARAESVVVALKLDENQITLTVSDDGRGFDPTESKGGMGLRTMRERARSIRGTIDIVSRPACDGTIVRITVPFTA